VASFVERIGQPISRFMVTMAVAPSRVYVGCSVDSTLVSPFRRLPDQNRSMLVPVLMPGGPVAPEGQI
jgi:hypothetical protein